MAEEKDEEKETEENPQETPEASPPEEKQTPKEEAPETAEKPEETPEVEPEEAPKETPEEETPKEEEADKQVPLSELQKERERRRQEQERRRQAEQAMFDSRQTQTPTEVPELDPDAAQAVTAISEKVASQKYEERRSQEFVKKHGEFLQGDPLLDNTVKGIMADENRQGRYIDPFDALEQAKELLDTRLKPQVDKAKEDSFKEGQQKAKEKAKAGAVGSSGPRPEVDEKEMSSEEFAKYHNIPRAN